MFNKLISGVFFLIVLVRLLGGPINGQTMTTIVALIVAILSIWFPDSVNDYTIGLWVDGYRIENATPRWMIAFFGWVILFLLIFIH